VTHDTTREDDYHATRSEETKEKPNLLAEEDSAPLKSVRILEHFIELSRTFTNIVSLCWAGSQRLRLIFVLRSVQSVSFCCQKIKRIPIRTASPVDSQLKCKMAEVMAPALLLKDKANQLFKEGDYTRAIDTSIQVFALIRITHFRLSQALDADTFVGGRVVWCKLG